MDLCVICRRTDDEADLFEGIYGGGIVMVCKPCSNVEEIPLISKPRTEQIEQVERNISVRERLEKLSKQGEDTRTLSSEQGTANKNLGKIRFPKKRQESDSLIDNYYWEIQKARRNKKLSLAQVSQETGISIDVLEGFEKGQLSKNFESIAKILEDFYSIKLLITKDEILEEEQISRRYNPVTKEFSHSRKDRIDGVEDKERISNNKDIKNKISSGKFDFSKRENLKDISLNDLIEMKMDKEKLQASEKERKQHEEMFGEDIEIEDNSKDL